MLSTIGSQTTNWAFYAKMTRTEILMPRRGSNSEPTYTGILSELKAG
jgi:hypothetical protein